MKRRLSAFTNVLSTHRFLLTVVGLLYSATSIGSPDPVLTESGWLQGQSGRGAVRYLGIPYAAPPVDALRWRAPRDPGRWTGVRSAREFGAPCAQVGNFYASDDARTFGQTYGSEDCLTLNVWVPDAPHVGSRPVLLFIHGGGGVSGATSWSMYEATRMSHELDAVVISVNYRLGIFGGARLAALQHGQTLDDSGQFAVLDVIKSLEWVQRNIGAFGGDSNNVTVMGQSAGGITVWALLRSRLASGLFKRAICLSGLPMRMTAEEAEVASEKWLGRLMARDAPLYGGDQLLKLLSPNNTAGLRNYLYSKTTDEIVAATPETATLPNSVISEALIEAAADLPPIQNLETIDSSDEVVNAVPTIIGTVSNEMSLFMLLRFGKLDRAQLWDRFSGGRYDIDDAEFFGIFGWLKYRAVVPIMNMILRRKLSQSADLLVKSHVPVYRYEFRWNDMPSPWRRLIGAYHGLDIPFLFGNFADDHPTFSRFSWGPESEAVREEIHQKMIGSLKGFVESGNPNKYSTGVYWPMWNQQRQQAIFN